MGSINNFSFSEVIKQVMPRWKDLLKTPRGMQNLIGSPIVIVISSSGIRSVEVRRQLIPLKYPIAKLFAKHFKVEEQVEMLKSFMPLGVGTPNRLTKLADIGALNMDHIKLVVLDMHRDVKKCCILDLADVRDDLMLFYRKYLASRVLKGDCDICIV